MASYTVAAGEHGAYRKTLVASTVDTVTFDVDLDKVEVIGDGSSDIFVTVDGSTPTVDGKATFILPAGAITSRVIVTNWENRKAAGGTVVKLVSSGTPVYSVAEVSS